MSQASSSGEAQAIAPSDPAQRKPGRLSTVAKALDLLEILADEPREWGVTEIARRLDLSKSVVHGLLVTLQDRDFVAGDPRTRRYRLGLKAMRLGAGVDLHQELRVAALPILHELTAAAGEASYLMIRQGLRAVTVARALTAAPMRISVDEGMTTALHAGASGKAILAFSAPEIVESVITETGIPKMASQTITSREQLIANLDQIRADGYAYSESEAMEGVFALAVPVLGANGINASLGLVGIAAGLGDRRSALLSLLTEHAGRITRALGGTPHR